MADGITRIAVEGFKSISKRQEIEIAPLTILAGANSSGKSSIMQPLLMLKQTLEAPYDPGPLKIDGPNVEFTNIDQFLSRTNLRLEIVSGDEEYKLLFRKGGSGLEFAQRSTFQGQMLELGPFMSQSDIRAALGSRIVEGKPTILRDRFLLNIGVGGGTPITSQWVEPFLRNLIHVPGSRGDRSRTYPALSPGPTFPGTFESYVASVINYWQLHDPARLEELRVDLHHMGLARGVRAQKLNDTAIDLRALRLPEGEDRDEVSVADMGLGIPHVLPVLAALRSAREGHIVYIEQPEIHLHPRAQTRLADILADAAKRGVRIVAETHSSLLLRAIQTLVAKGDLEPDLVRLHWFSRDADGITHVTSATPDRNGAFGDWPEDFGDVALQSEKDYLDAVETKLVR
jgi:hypothetical protein